MLRVMWPSSVPTIITSTFSLSSGKKGRNRNSIDARVVNTNTSSLPGRSADQPMLGDGPVRSPHPEPPETGRGLILGRAVSTSKKISSLGKSTGVFFSWPSKPSEDRTSHGF